MLHRRYDVSATSPLIFKPNNLQIKAAKQTNVAGLFSSDTLNASPLNLVWRMRLYMREKLLAAAKPLWLLPAPLALKKGQCQRLV